MLIEDRNGIMKSWEEPYDINLNLMETLKIMGYPMRAACGGMGLCADCHCNIISGYNQLSAPNDQEVDTLEILPQYYETGRLACQIREIPNWRELSIKLLGKDI